MKSLFDYILEARETVGSLPFTREQFQEFTIAVDDYDDESDIWKFMEETITKAYGAKVWDTFKGWVEGNMRGKDADVLYDILMNLPKERLGRVLGAGSFGSAIDAGDKVIKVFHGDTPMEQKDREFYTYCLRHKSKVFPVVYKVGSKVVVLEKLKMNTPKCKLYDKWLGFNAFQHKTKDFDCTIEGLALNIFKGRKDKKLNALESKVPAEAKECLDWAVQALIELEKATGFNNGFSDLRLANLGERKDGSIIWFDI